MTEGDSFVHYCGYDWRDTDRFNEEFEFWRPLLPQSVRHYAPDDFGRACAYDCGLLGEAAASVA